ncbi:hypothetical protein NP233_g4948 [Leucocoprinus birnbaumii]|uniref:Nephrocystin 3-like N-terminal domain-containing protein n=1 Tax=Leucocoprinus birnbaumii TaxID=56174 RepID=A0AAD5W065_9AGAR|nr:hypothetical protein NP233_g4948 [Leucocoprinus birnbaumii]
MPYLQTFKDLVEKFNGRKQKEPKVGVPAAAPPASAPRTVQEVAASNHSFSTESEYPQPRIVSDNRTDPDSRDVSSSQVQDLSTEPQSDLSSASEDHIDPTGAYSSGELRDNRGKPPENKANKPDTLVQQEASSHNSSPGDFFPGASNVAFAGPVTMISQIVDSKESRLGEWSRFSHFSADRALPAAIHDSSYRAYPPRCHEDTRRTLRNNIITWCENPNRQQKVKWFMGPAGVGKSAIAQTIAEELAVRGILGGTFFFSRPAKLDDPDAVIPTLAYQLAMKNPDYKHLITQRLGEDPLVLTKNRSTLFKELIIEPFQILAIAKGNDRQRPLLIILDGLDECRDRESQCEFVHLIDTHTKRSEGLPLLWMICSRPEWHLKSILSDVDNPVNCEQKEIFIDDEEARADARRLLSSGISKIRKRNGLPLTWPSKDQLDVVTKAASGHLGFVSFILRFTADTSYGDPCEQLHLCVKVISGSGVDPGTLNPLEALDRLYFQILSVIPPSVLSTSMRILGLSIIYSGHTLSAEDHAGFLFLTQASYNSALRQLHSVVHVPSPEEAFGRPLKLYHTSFSDFLKDPVRSGRFGLNEDQVHYEVFINSLRHLNALSGRSITGPPMKQESITEFCHDVMWNACSQLPANSDRVPDLLKELACFDFERIALPIQTRSRAQYFALFISWLYSLPTPQRDSFIKIVEGPDPDQLIINTEYCSVNWREFMATFIQEGIEVPQPPVEITFSLKATPQVIVSLTILDHPSSLDQSSRRIRIITSRGKKGSFFGSSTESVSDDGFIDDFWPEQEPLGSVHDWMDRLERTVSGKEGESDDQELSGTFQRTRLPRL